MNSVLNDWETRKLKFVATCNDEALSETTDPEFEMEYVDISSVNLVEGVAATETVTFDKAPSRARRVVQDGDTIISTVRTYLKAIASIESPPANMVVSTGFAVIRPRDEIDGSFLGYALQNTAFIESVVANSTGVSYPAINPSLLTSLPIAFPRSLATQQQIAAFLDWKTSQIDALIAKKQTLLQKLKEKRLAVITQAVTKGLNPDAPMRDSGIAWLGNVPTSWEVKKLKFVGEAIIGLTYDPDDVSDHLDGTLVLRANNIQEGKLVASDPVYVNAEIPHKLKLLPLDILICSRNGSRRLIGKCGLVTESFVGCTFGAFNTVFRSDANSYIYYVLNSSLFEFQAGSYLTSTINQLTIGTLNSFVVPVPPIAEQNDIVESLWESGRSFEKMLDKVESAITRLTEYRSALITAATTGKIDVRNVAIPAHA